MRLATDQFGPTDGQLTEIWLDKQRKGAMPPRHFGHKWLIIFAVLAATLMVAKCAHAEEATHKYVDDRDLPHPHTTIPSQTFLPCGWTDMGHGVERLVDCDARVVCFLKREHGAACFKL